MPNISSISQRLYDLLITRGFNPESTDEQGQASQPADAKTFSFDWIGSSGRNYGTVVCVITEDKELLLFFGDNLGKSMEEPDKDEWFQFLHQLRQFATRNDFYTFSPRNLNQLKHTMAGMSAIKEGLFENYYGTRQVSYMGKPTEARLMIRHNRSLEEGDARHRYIQALFIETVDQERFRLPFINLTGGRAMLEHVRQGGRPYDIRGVHIANMVQEAKLLNRFRRASQGRVLEGVSQEVVASADVYYQNLRENLRSLTTGRGYQTYFETWTPNELTQTDNLVEDLKQLFVEQTLDQRIEEALPILARLQGTAMKEADIFESWVDRVAEGTQDIIDTPEAKKKLGELLAQELPVGPDATNAREQLYDIFDDDELFDRLADLAQRDPDADARDVIRGRASELGLELPEAPVTSAPVVSQPEANAAPNPTSQPASGAQDTKQMEEGDNLATFVGPNESREPGGFTADQLEIGDPVIVTGAVRYQGATGVIEDFGRDKQFVVVNLYDHGRHSFQSSDVEFDEYADSDADMREDSTNPMDHRGAVTDSFYEDLARIKRLALSK